MHYLYLIDDMRHLACWPYSKQALHDMAKELGIKRCWFHRDHYDCPKGRFEELLIDDRMTKVSSQDMMLVVRRRLAPAWLLVEYELMELDRELDEDMDDLLTEE